MANEFLQCRKVCEHVLDKILGADIAGVSGMSNNSQTNQNDNNSEGSQIPPEDKIELFCNNVVSSFCVIASLLSCSTKFCLNLTLFSFLFFFNSQSVDPNMDLRTVRHFIWKQSVDLTFYYKTKSSFLYN